MNPDHEPHPESVNCRLAKSLSAERETIISEWLDRVRHDPSIPTGSLTTAAIKNHMPQLFDDLTATLRYYEDETVAKQTGTDALEHGTTRWRQGYSLTEMLSEIKHFRAILIRHMRVFEDANQDLGMASRLFVSTTLHAFLDDVAIDASRQFMVEVNQPTQNPEERPVVSPI